MSEGLDDARNADAPNVLASAIPAVPKAPLSINFLLVIFLFKDIINLLSIF